MSTRYDTIANSEWLLDGGSTSFRASNIAQMDCTTDLTAIATGVMTTVALPLQAGDVVTNLTFKSGATAANGPTAWWFALYSPAGALLAQTADQTSTAWAANTTKTVALASAQAISSTGVYYAGVMMAASTAVPSLIGKTVGIAGAAASILGSKVLAQTSGSGLTTTAPATISSPTTVATIPLVIAT